MKKLFVAASIFLGLLGVDHVPRGPVTVADFVESDQTTPQSQTYMPSADGLFQVSTYVEISGALSNTLAMAVMLSYTDDLRTEGRQQPFAPAFLGPPSPSAGGAPRVVCSIRGSNIVICQGTVVIRAKGEEPITIGFGTEGTLSLPQGASYTAYAIVEQL